MLLRPCNVPLLDRKFVYRQSAAMQYSLWQQCRFQSQYGGNFGTMAIFQKHLERGYAVQSIGGGFGAFVGYAQDNDRSQLCGLNPRLRWNNDFGPVPGRVI